VLLVDELMDRQQLDRRHAEGAQVVDRGGMREPGVGAADVLGNLRVPLREALEVHLVDDRLVQLAAERPVAAPVERAVDDDRLGHVRTAVGVVALQVVAAQRIGEHGRVPVDVPGDGAGIRIDEQLRRIAAVPLRRLPWTVDAKTVTLARADTGQVAVPAERGALRQVDARFTALLVEETELDPRRHFGEEREVGPAAIGHGAEREWLSRTNVHRHARVDSGAVASAGSRRVPHASMNRSWCSRATL
jgi:hypothetical protein